MNVTVVGSARSSSRWGRSCSSGATTACIRPRLGRRWRRFTGALARLPPFQALRALGATRFAFRADQFTAYAAGGRAASGLGAMPLIDVDGSDGLERLLPRTPLPSLPVYLCWRRDARDLPAVQALKDFVVDKLRAKLR